MPRDRRVIHCQGEGPAWPGRRIALGTIMAGLSAATAARAQTTLSRGIRFIVGFPPGSTTDTVARFYAERLARRIGQPVVVDNRPGGQGFIGIAAMQAAPADGYTVLIGSTSTLATNAALFRQLPYDPVRDLEPLTMMLGIPALIVVAANGPFRTLGDLRDAASRAPGTLNYASGAASFVLMTELFNQLAGIRTNNIPYRGVPDAVTAVIGGQVDFAVADVTSTLGLIQGGTLRPLLVVADRRVPVLPDVPSAPEAGLVGLEAMTWVGAAVAPQTPAPLRRILTDELVAIVEEPGTAAHFEPRGGVILPVGPGAMRRFQVNNIALWRDVAARAGVVPQ